MKKTLDIKKLVLLNMPYMQKLWESYRRKFSYAADLEWSIIMGAVRSLYALCEKGSSL